MMKHIVITITFVLVQTTLEVAPGAGQDSDGKSAMSSTSTTSKTITEPREAPGQPLFAGRDFDAWVHLLRVDLDNATRAQAVKAIGVLGRHGRQEDVLQILVPLLKSEERWLVQSSAQALAGLNDRANQNLIDLLRNDNFPFREYVVDALGNAGPSASLSTPALLELAGSPDLNLRRKTFAALVRIGSPDTTIAVALDDEVARNDDSHAVTTIVYGLAESPMAHETKERLLVKWMGSSDRSIAQSAAMSLARTGQDSAASRDAILQALRAYASDPNQRGAFPNPAADGVSLQLYLPLIVTVAQELDIKDPKIRDGAFMRTFVDRAGDLGERGQPMVPVLVKLLAAAPTDGALGQLETNIVRSLMEIGPSATHALPVLRRLKQQLEANTTMRENTKAIQLRSIDQAIRRIEIAQPDRQIERQ
jgi:hypothetical protein